MRILIFFLFSLSCFSLDQEEVRHTHLLFLKGEFKEAIEKIHFLLLKNSQDPVIVDHCAKVLSKMQGILGSQPLPVSFHFPASFHPSILRYREVSVQGAKESVILTGISDFSPDHVRIFNSTTTLLDWNKDQGSTMFAVTLDTFAAKGLYQVEVIKNQKSWQGWFLFFDSDMGKVVNHFHSRQPPSGLVIGENPGVKRFTSELIFGALRVIQVFDVSGIQQIQ